MVHRVTGEVAVLDADDLDVAHFREPSEDVGRVWGDPSLADASAQSGETVSDSDGGGTLVPQPVGALPILRMSVPPFAIWS